ncbi:hypothetical protein OOU_Y34scaffold00726g32 [Pyricularia oryzae Y34]|uniref:Uncharacterized protein n=2 Tax=Pyricularia oryzae TaxID=318829 RepID=A0AA97NRW6_PYRO3|nr:hypothetical protein OOU_Y34scaffold00726g32 [Pyricularia oryzae Y34]
MAQACGVSWGPGQRRYGCGTIGGSGRRGGPVPLKWMCRGLQLGVATTWMEGLNKYYFSWYLRNKWSYGGEGERSAINILQAYCCGTSYIVYRDLPT